MLKGSIDNEINILYLFHLFLPIALDFSEQFSLVSTWAFKEEVKEHIKSRPN